jgi:ABC-type amino acid transport substrate-binding protein
MFFCSSAECSHVPNKIDSIKTYKDIPGVTEEEISAIEALKAGRDKFSYGSNLTTEAFMLPDGSYTGFSIKFCEFLSEIFGIKFVLEIYQWDELINKLESKTVDFTGELTPTEERKKKYVMTHPIAERLLRIFTRANSKIHDESDVEGFKIGF